LHCYKKASQLVLQRPESNKNFGYLKNTTKNIFEW
jgi:hypothetical protein